MIVLRRITIFFSISSRGRASPGSLALPFVLFRRIDDDSWRTAGRGVGADVLGFGGAEFCGRDSQGRVEKTDRAAAGQCGYREAGAWSGAHRRWILAGSAGGRIRRGNIFADVPWRFFAVAFAAGRAQVSDGVCESVRDVSAGGRRRQRCSEGFVCRAPGRQFVEELGLGLSGGRGRVCGAVSEVV